MLLDNAQIILEGSRIIGLKNSDMTRLENAMKAQTSSFTAPIDAAPIEPEVPVMEEVVPTPLEPTVPVEEVPVKVDDQVVEEVPVNTNIFDQGIPSYNEPIQNSTVSFEAEQPSEVSSVEETSPVLDTPQEFFNKEEAPVQNNNSYMNEDTAIIILDNLRKLIEDKNSMINALSDKVQLLENQLKSSEEARKVLEAQRDAAHTTLAQAREAEGGPTLVYSQNINNQNAA